MVHLVFIICGSNRPPHQSKARILTAQTADGEKWVDRAPGINI
jgi:hypothetical protein